MRIMKEKRAFLIGGGGTLGGYASVELLKAGWSVDVLAPEPLPSLTRRLRHFRGTADDATLREIFARNRYDVVVDFLHYRDSDAYRARADFLLDNTDQLVFLSSYRVYAGARDPEPITETSPLLLDVAPAEFAVQDRYAAPKTREERYLRSCGRKNWTIVRPLISFSHFRLDLLLTGGDQLLPRSRAGKPMLLPEEARDLTAGVGWAGNVGKMFAGIAGNGRALGEAFTFGTGERRTWSEVAGYYEDLLGAKFVWVPAADYVACATPDDFVFRQAWTYDRALSRLADCTKVRAVCGLTDADFLSIRAGIVQELDFLRACPDLVRRFDTPLGAEIAARTDAYLAERGLA